MDSPTAEQPSCKHECRHYAECRDADAEIQPPQQGVGEGIDDDEGCHVEDGARARVSAWVHGDFLRAE